MRVFLSYATHDRAWAEWATWYLRAAGHDVEVDVDWRYGDSFPARMRQALQECDTMVALFSPHYFTHTYTMMELDAWIARPQAAQGLIPMRIAECDVPNLYRPYLRADLHAVPSESAGAILLGALETRTAVPAGANAGPRPPMSALPAVWRVPSRNGSFVGRDELLASLHDRLHQGERAVVQTLQGWGGVGKTQLAIEYAHRFAGGYDLVWWVDSARPELIGDQFADLAVRVDVVSLGTATPLAAAAVKDYLRTQPGSLLVFDNAAHPTDIWDWLPGGSAHVLITSRFRVWAGVASAVEVDVFSWTESVELLTSQVPIPEERAKELAEFLGYLPLAIAQAAGLLASTGMSVGLYRQLLAEHALRTLELGSVTGYPVSLAASIQLSLQRLAETDPVALAMIRVCALLAPEPVPVQWFANLSPANRPVDLRSADAAQLFQAAGVLGGLGLARPFPEGLLLHRLTLAVVADSLTPAERTEAAAAARSVIVATYPDDDDGPEAWPLWQALLPHLLALEPATSTDPALRRAGIRAAWYQDRRGDYRPAHDLAAALHAAFATSLGDEHDDTLAAAIVLAHTHRRFGEHDAARTLQQHAMDVYRRRRGEDHADTLNAADNLATTLRVLGEHVAARDLMEQTLLGWRRALGDAHPETLRTANNLGRVLQSLGDYPAACDVLEQTLVARRRVLGNDHPDTLNTAQNLGRTLHLHGEFAAARDLLEQTLAARRRVLGEHHPDALNTANNLGRALQAMAEYAAARDLFERTLIAQRRVLGDNHRDTLNTAANLAETQRRLGEPAGP